MERDGSGVHTHHSPLAPRERLGRTVPLVSVGSSIHSVVQIRGDLHRYSVLVGSDLLRRAGAYVRKHVPGQRCAIISDDKVAPLFAKRVEKSLTSAGFQPTLITIAAGEKSKTLEQAGGIWDQMIAARLDRQSLVIGLGGGMSLLGQESRGLGMGGIGFGDHRIAGCDRGGMGTSGRGFGSLASFWVCVPMHIRATRLKLAVVMNGPGAV